MASDASLAPGVVAGKVLAVVLGIEIVVLVHDASYATVVLANEHRQALLRLVGSVACAEGVLALLLWFAPALVFRRASASLKHLLGALAGALAVVLGLAWLNTFIADFDWLFRPESRGAPSSLVDMRTVLAGPGLQIALGFGVWAYCNFKGTGVASVLANWPRAHEAGD